MARRLLASVALAALCGAASALAASPTTPRADQLAIKSLLGRIGAPDLALVPTRLPAHFAFESFSVTGSPVGLEISLADQRFLKTPAEARLHEITLGTAYLKGGLARCGSSARKTLRAGSMTVYSDGTSVWRCLRGSRGRIVKASARGRLADTALATLVASARPVR